MFNRATMLSAVVATMIAAPALAGGDLVGEAGPELEIKEWCGTDNLGNSLKSMRGKAVIIEFFATW